MADLALVAALSSVGDSHFLSLCSTVLFFFHSDDDFLSKQQYDELRRCYVSRLDFGGQSFDEALRLFLCDSGFRLPGEAQKIDRMLEAFCQRFVADNPGVFRNSCQCAIATRPHRRRLADREGEGSSREEKIAGE